MASKYDVDVVLKYLETLMPESVWMCVYDDIEDHLKLAHAAGYRAGIEASIGKLRAAALTFHSSKARSAMTSAANVVELLLATKEPDDGA